MKVKTLLLLVLLLVIFLFAGVLDGVALIAGEAARLADENDLDDDGVLNDADNCPTTFNPTQDDLDENGVGDLCEGSALTRMTMMLKMMWKYELFWFGCDPDGLGDIFNYELQGAYPGSSSIAHYTDLYSARTLYGGGNTRWLDGWTGYTFGAATDAGGSLFQTRVQNRQFAMGMPGQLWYATPDGKQIWLDGSWRATNLGLTNEQPFIVAMLDEDTTAYFSDTPNAPLPEVQVNGLRNFSLGGVIAAARQDADTIHVYLVEGMAVMDGQEFTHALDGVTALHIQAGATGAASAEIVPISALDEIVPLQARSLHLRMRMWSPVAESSATADQVWHIMLDADGDQSTGFTANQMYAELGTDIAGDLVLREDGSLAGFMFAIDEQFSPLADIPLTVRLSRDRRVIDVYVPTYALYAALQTADQGVILAPNTLRWRVAAVNYRDRDDPPKDVFPEVDPALVGEPRLNQNGGGTLPDGLSIRTSHRVNGAEVSFSEENVSPDANNPIIGRVWDFGDGATATESVVTHTYAAAGTYRVTLTLTFQNGASITVPLEVTVERGSAMETPVTGAAEPSGDSCSATVNSNANLRAGAGTNFDRVGSVAAGDTVSVTGQNAAADWYRLAVEGQDSAWIAAFLISAPACPAGFALPVIP